MFTFSGKLSILEITALNWPGNQSSGEHPGHPLLFYKTMGKNGWIKIHRKLQDSPIMSKPEYLTVWIHLLLLANHEKTEFIFNNQKMVLESGQLITSRQKLAAVCGIQESKIDRILKYLKSEQQIEQQTNNKFRLITIKNWNLYQQSEQQNEQPVNNQRTTSEQPVNTYKNVKNEKNEKNEITTTLQEEQEKLKNVLVKWLSGFEKISSPEGFANKILEEYPARAIRKAMANSCCTSISQLYTLLDYYKNS